MQPRANTAETEAQVTVKRGRSKLAPSGHATHKNGKDVDVTSERLLEQRNKGMKHRRSIKLLEKQTIQLVKEGSG